MVEPASAVLISIAAGIGAKAIANLIKKWIANKEEGNITVKLPNGAEITLSKDQQSVDGLHKEVETLRSKNF